MEGFKGLSATSQMEEIIKAINETRNAMFESISKGSLGEIMKFQNPLNTNFNFFSTISFSFSHNNSLTNLY